MPKKKKESRVETKGDGISSISEGKRGHISSWPDEKLESVWVGHKNGEYVLGDDDVIILEEELKKRKLGDFSDQKLTDDYMDADEEEQVPIGYIKIYPETPERNEFYRKRYANAKKAWTDTNIIQKGEDWFIIAKGDSEEGYDVHLFFTRGKTVVHGTCTCADFSQRGIRRNFPCKHIFMVLVKKGLSPKWKDME
jgi:hypothetical protein